MKQAIIRSFCFDGDVCEVTFRYDHLTGKHLGEYPDFDETPRYTPMGRPWTTAMQEGCRHGVSKYAKDARCLDCGSCTYFKQELPGDLIGICENEQMPIRSPHSYHKPNCQKKHSDGQKG